MPFLKHVFWSQGYRPLFLLSSIAAIMGIIGWDMFIAGYWMPNYILSGSSLPAMWHAHEMIFGFAGAAIGGFLLTAVPNWTGKPPISSINLFILTICWVAGRLGLWLAIESKPLLQMLALADIAYFIGLTLWISYAIAGSGNKRNLGFILLTVLLTLFNALFHFGADINPGLQPIAIYGALASVLVILNIIGGRIIPMFTANWVKQNLPINGSVKRQNPTIEKASHASLSLFLILLTFYPQSIGVALVGIATFGILIYRWSMWRFWDIASEPLLWVLHLGYLWVPLGILLIVVSPLLDISQSAGIHALTTGAIGTIVLGVTSRVALGHSGRPLTSRPLLTATYTMITVSALLRVLVATGFVASWGLHIATLFWVAAFGLFLVLYWPILTRPRVA